MTIFSEYYSGFLPQCTPGEPLLWLPGAGHECVTAQDQYCYDNRKRDYTRIILQMTISGAGFYERAGKKMTVGPGMAFMDLAPGDFRYGGPLNAQEPYEFVWVTIIGQVAENTFAYIRREFGNVLTFGPQNNLTPLMLNFARIPMSRPFDRYARAIEIYRLLATLQGSLQRSRIAASSVVSSALEVLSEARAIRDVNVSQLAAKLGCSREHLSREFKRRMKVTLSNYVASQRIQQAAQALAGTDDKLESIATRCGFANVSYFGYVFRKQMGVTPRQYRLQFDRSARRGSPP